MHATSRLLKWQIPDRADQSAIRKEEQLTIVDEAGDAEKQSLVVPVPDNVLLFTPCAH